MSELIFRKYRTYVNCETKQEINMLLRNCEVLTSKEDLLKGWEKYGDEIVCEILFNDSESSDYQKPTICSYGAITDKIFQGEEILTF